jgi:beta-glucosidase/6-phospho-beta-glucosidase/beta-galactosidase
LVITEHGWPTGPGRTQTRQAEVLRTVIDVIAASASELNITGYIHHTLRDACSAGDGLFCQFGLMTDDYAPKPAFHVYRDLIDALTTMTES